MQATNRTRKRKSGRAPTEELKALSLNAFRIGKPARRIYASVRLSMTKRNANRLYKIAAIYGITISKAARELLNIEGAIDDGETGNAQKILARYKAKKPRGPRRKTISAFDIWRQSEGGRNRQAVCLKLTAWQLAEIEESQDENRAKRLGRTFSRAFDRLLSYGGAYFDRLIKSVEESGLYGEAEKEERPTKAKKAKTAEEQKRPIIDKGKKTSL